MKRYLRKHPEVTAAQLVEGEPWLPCVNYHETCQSSSAPPNAGGCSLCGQMWVQTSRGPTVVKYGDWIVADHRHIWTMKSAEFESDYRGVELNA